MTYNERFDDVVRKLSHRVAFRLKTPEGYREMTYGEVHRQSRGVALGLAAIGLKPGARVGILSENRPEWVIAYLGIYLAGGTAVPLDTQISASEWKRLLDDSESQAVFVSESLLPRLRDVLLDSHLVGKTICFDPVGGDRDLRSELAGFLEWAGSIQPPPALPESRLSDVVVLIYTSGTTGKPKGVMLTQGNIVSEIEAVRNSFPVDENDTFLCLLPLQHVLASVVNVLLPLYLGAQVTFIDTLKRAEIMEALEQGGITILATVPQFFYLFHNRIHEELGRKPPLIRFVFRSMKGINRFCLRYLGLNLGKLAFARIHKGFGRRLRYFVSGGSAFDPRVAQDFHDFGFTILQGYGLTETTGGCTVTRVENNVVGSVGPPLPGVDVSIADPGDDGIGEVRIRGPIIMKGYYKNPEATADALRDGWFYSGDLGRIDDRGNLYITGRSKEVIVLPNGKNIYPDEIETHYLQCPYIGEIAVIGVAEQSSRTNERLHGVVVPNFEYLRAKKIANAREILRDEIGRWSNQLPKYKRLMSYQIQKDPLPRTTTRKIKRLELKRAIESGAAPAQEAASNAQTVSPEDRALLESPAGVEVIRTLGETYRRTKVDPGMNLELDLGFDSMERVELLASLEQSLRLTLPEDFGAEIFTVRDLIARLGEQSGAAAGSAGGQRQNWSAILSKEALDADTDQSRFRFTGWFLSTVKYIGLRVSYLLFRTVLRLEVRGRDNLRPSGPFLICPNHLSYLDPFVVMSILPYRIFRKVFFVGASEYYATWYMRFLARLANIIPVDPDAHLLRAMKVGAYGLRSGRVLCIFPEGARSFDGELKEFKKGAAILAHELRVPVVPVGIRGTHAVWPRDSMKIRPHKVSVYFGAPLEAKGGDPYQEDTDRLQEAVRRLIAE
jgi:long-chain acyl-CoA synthetase